MTTGLGDGVVNASLEPGQPMLASCSLAAEEQHQDEVVLGSPEAGSEPVGPHTHAMSAGSICLSELSVWKGEWVEFPSPLPSGPCTLICSDPFKCLEACWSIVSCE